MHFVRLDAVEMLLVVVADQVGVVGKCSLLINGHPKCAQLGTSWGVAADSCDKTLMTCTYGLNSLILFILIT